MTFSKVFFSGNFFNLILTVFEDKYQNVWQGHPSHGGFGGPPPGNFSKIDPYFLQSGAFLRSFSQKFFSGKFYN